MHGRIELFNYVVLLNKYDIAKELTSALYEYVNVISLFYFTVFSFVDTAYKLISDIVTKIFLVKGEYNPLRLIF